MNKKGIKCIPLSKHLCGRLPRGMPLSSSIDVSATPLPPPPSIIARKLFLVSCECGYAVTGKCS